MIAQTKSKNLREEAEEEEEAAHQTQETEEEIPATINEGGAQGP